MFSKSKVIFLLLLTLGASWTLAQPKQVNIHQVVLDEDAQHDRFICSHGGHIEILGDSTFPEILIHKASLYGRKMARILLKKSKLFRNNKIVKVLKHPHPVMNPQIDIDKPDLPHIPYSQPKVAYSCQKLIV